MNVGVCNEAGSTVFKRMSPERPNCVPKTSTNLHRTDADGCQRETFMEQTINITPINPKGDSACSLPMPAPTIINFVGQLVWVLSQIFVVPCGISSSPEQLLERAKGF